MIRAENNALPTSDTTDEQPAGDRLRIDPAHSDKKFAKYLAKRIRKRNKRSIQATEVVAIGGSAIATASRLKDLLERQGTESFVRFNCVDTDETAQSGAAGFAGFTDNEFVSLQTMRVRNVIDNPNAHKEIVELVGLDTVDRIEFHRQLLKKGLEQAGQVRSFGHLSQLSEFITLRNSLNRTIGQLRNVNSSLEKELSAKHAVQIRRHLTIFVLFSCAGGTGSSMALTTMALLRSLTKNMQVEIVAVMILPSTFDHVMEGKSNQAVRIYANAAATMLEMNAARTGHFERIGLKVGPNDRERVPVESVLFNQLLIAGRHLADGLQLPTAEAVYDAIAMHLAAIIGTEIADRVKADDNNEATLAGLSRDPITGQERYVSILGAQSLALPVQRMIQSFGAQQTIEFLDNAVIGQSLNANELSVMVSDWVQHPLEEDEFALEAASLATSLQRSCLPDVNTITRSVYQSTHGRSKTYYRNKQFVNQLEHAQRQFQQRQLTEIDSRLAELSTSIRGDLAKAFTKRREQLVQNYGWQAADQFTKAVLNGLSEALQQLEAGAEADAANARTFTARLQEVLTPMRSKIRGTFVNSKRQDQAVIYLQSICLSLTNERSKRTAVNILNALVNQLMATEQRAKGVIQNAIIAKKKMKILSHANRAGKQLTTLSQIELDVSTPETDRKLYERFRLTSADILQKLLAKIKPSTVPTSTVLSKLVEESKIFNLLTHLLQQYFDECLDDVSIVDLLADQLADPTCRDHTLTLMTHVVHGCQPLARAESGQNNVEFADSMLLGIPESQSEEKRALVVKTLEEAASQRIHADGQYNGEASAVTSGDSHRIYVIRRTHGVCLHYLPEAVQAHADYELWNRLGGHSVHIFNSKMVMDIPEIIPSGNVDDGEMAFAIGATYGWLANRGPCWFWNMEKDGQAAKFQIPLASHWQGIAFQHGGLNSKSLALKLALQQGKFEYQLLSESAECGCIGQSLSEAMLNVMSNGEMIEQIHEAFHALRMSAGDLVVADELEVYVSQLRLRQRTNDANSMIIRKMIDCLVKQIQQLRAPHI